LRHQIAIDRLAGREPLIPDFKARDRLVRCCRFLTIRGEDRAFERLRLNDGLRKRKCSGETSTKESTGNHRFLSALAFNGSIRTVAFALSPTSVESVPRNPKPNYHCRDEGLPPGSSLTTASWLSSGDGSASFEEGRHNEMRELGRGLDICNSFEHVEDAPWPTPKLSSTQRQFRWMALISVSFLAVLQ
jgi:hypothetical protein